MKKVRVLKEMPFAKVGRIFDVNDGGSIGETYPFSYMWFFSSDNVNELIKDGWLELVEEKKSLEEKLKEYLGTNSFKGEKKDKNGYEYYLLQHFDVEELAFITKQHYLDVFDKATDERWYIEKDEERVKIARDLLIDIKSYLRKALEEA